MLCLLFDNTCVNCENVLDQLKNTGCYFITVTRSRSKGMHLKRNSFSECRRTFTLFNLKIFATEGLYNGVFLLAGSFTKRQSVV